MAEIIRGINWKNVDAIIALFMFLSVMIAEIIRDINWNNVDAISGLFCH